MDSNYQILFTIRLLHEYFLDEKSIDIAFIPAKESKAFTAGAGILCRQIDNRFIALIRENDLHQPFFNVPPDKHFRNSFGREILRLYLKIENSGFNNYTNVTAGSRQIAYFSNLAGNKIDNPAPTPPFLYLSKRISDHSQGREYLPGNFVMAPATDNVFEAIKKHDSTSVSELADTSLWLPRQSKQFPSGDDMINFAGDIFQFPLSSPVPQAVIQVFGFNCDPAAPDFSILLKEETQSFGTPTSKVNVDLHDIPAGRYKINVGAETQTIFHDPFLMEENVYGVIEIFNFLPGTDDYSILNDDEMISSKDFTIRFPARSVLWKYIRKNNKAQSITDTGTTAYSFVLSDNEFVSTVPIPLSETPLSTLRLTFIPPDHEIFPLPNPAGNRLGRHRQNDFDYLSADVFLNY